MDRVQETADIHKLLVDSVRDYAIFALDSTGHIISWNAGARRLKGYAPHEIIGKHFSIFYPQSARDAGFPDYELRVASKEGRFEDEGWRIRKDGSRFWANVVITALRDQTNMLVGFAKVTRDLTERREAEARAIEDARRLAEVEAANRAKSEFLATMSHELRTPLNAIAGYTELLDLGIQGPVTEAQRESLARIRNAQQHLLSLITDLLNFSKLEAGRVTYELDDVQLDEITRSARPMIEPQAAARNITIEWQPAAEPVIAYGDRSKIEQIALNLLTNAVKFTRPGGQIRVRQYSTGEWAALEVADNGIGIPADKLESIFEPFVQVGRSLTSPHEGTGLGLAISRELARAMHGDLTAASSAEGSTFTLTLPRSNSA